MFFRDDWVVGKQGVFAWLNVFKNILLWDPLKSNVSHELMPVRGETDKHSTEFSLNTEEHYIDIRAINQVYSCQLNL